MKMSPKGTPYRNGEGTGTRRSRDSSYFAGKIEKERYSPLSYRQLSGGFLWVFEVK
jgi:hypothetical protein